MRRRDFLLGSAGVAALGVAGCGGSRASADTRSTGSDEGAPNDGAPNVVVVYADDMRLDELPFMPFTRSLVAQGAEFTQARQMTPLCSPARAGFLSGRYANGPNGHEVVSQRSSFTAMEGDSLAPWLADAGVTCGLVGKYFVGLSPEAAPGWSFWRSPFGGAEGGQAADAPIRHEDGSVETPSQRRSPYFADQCEAFIRATTSPWFLWFCPTDPHYPLDGTDGHHEAFTDLAWPRPSDALEGEPTYIRDLPPPDVDAVAAMRWYQRLRLRELLDLDDGVRQIWETLSSTGQLDRTVVLFTSDNGIALLDHRITTLGKDAPYDACMRVPLVAVGPGFTAGTRAETPVTAAQDLTSTVLDVFGVEPGHPVDGVSLRRLASQPDPGREVLGHCDAANAPPGMPTCDIVTTVDRKLTRYRGQGGADRYELYELDTDPGELVNVAHDGRHDDEVAALDARLQALLDG